MRCAQPRGCWRIPVSRRFRSHRPLRPTFCHRSRSGRHSRSRPRSRSQPQQQVEPAAPRKPEGFFDAFGRWWDKSNRDFKAKVDDANAKWRASVEETNAKLKASNDETNAKLKASVEQNNARWRELSEQSEKAAKEAAIAQKEAADAFKNLAKTRVIEGRQVCEVAPNGSPDCQAAAEVICKGKGFAIGKSADITTTRKCSARASWSGTTASAARRRR